ncbi:metabolite traffic protein EboE [Membranihabitans maritimus]|uniref:metabolite traffic protein EboE n=1 Tax=Membranihabitans maritimus TaxID=2904244 RepID=UPI001F198641|nr:metabolite traffic protein EboE [Membranihabitans maritimus]
MNTKYGQLTYCSNIHPGEDWQDHFRELKNNIPAIKKDVSPNGPMGIGLRLANEASKALCNDNQFYQLTNWLKDNDCFVFTMNGFPYGGFHNTRVKDQVHTPDWTTDDRFEYTKRLFSLLSNLLPGEIQSGGISTSPLSYRPWWSDTKQLDATIHTATLNILKTAEYLSRIYEESGQFLHLDIEPEPDGILGNASDFFAWYLDILEPMARKYFGHPEKGSEIIRRHIQMCFDVCHFAVSYENPEEIVHTLEKNEIRVGKIQISSALEIDLEKESEDKIQSLAQFDEPVYLHQVVAQLNRGGIESFRDLDSALSGYTHGKYTSWRVHFHVPIFIEKFGLLQSTQKEIKDTLDLLKERKFTDHLEIETYTWGVLPKEMQVPTDKSIIREINWVKDYLH